MFGLGFWELLVILVIILLLFGAKRLPELARALGRAVREFKRGASDLSDEDKEEKKDEKPQG